MGTITRGTKSVGGTAFQAGSKAKAAEVNTDFDTVYSEFNGNIDNANVKASAGIDGSKLADGTVATAKLANDSVDNTKLKDSVAVDGDRAVTTDHIRDGAVTKAKHGAASVTSDKLDKVIHTQAYSFSALATSNTISAVTPSGGSAPFPKATWDLIGLFVKNLGGLENIEANAVDSGTDWTARINAYNHTGAPITATGTVVFIFLRKI